MEGLAARKSRLTSPLHRLRVRRSQARRHKGPMSGREIGHVAGDR
jgi:hypothetical protein